MNKIAVFILTALSVFLLNVPMAGTAEAARVAVVPIQIDDQKVERAADFIGYYWNIVAQAFQYPDYELVDDEKTENALPKEGLTSFTQDALAAICLSTDAEIVVAMRLDEVEQRIMNFRREQTFETFMKGEYASYNRLTGRYYRKSIYDKDEIEEVLTLRNDWQQNKFASELKRCINRTIEDHNKKNKKHEKY